MEKTLFPVKERGLFLHVANVWNKKRVESNRKKSSTKYPKIHRQELTDFTYTLIYTAFTGK